MSRCAGGGGGGGRRRYASAEAAVAYYLKLKGRGALCRIEVVRLKEGWEEQVVMPEVGK